ncbi:MAG: hypothetical protein ACSHYB_08600 [Roseibacillus sp.]
MDFTYRFILVTPNVDGPGPSLFMGHTAQSIFLRPALHILLKLPPSLHARNLTREKLVQHKLLGDCSHIIFPLMERDISKLKIGFEQSLFIFVSPEEIDESVASTLSAIKSPTLHLKSAELVRISEDLSVGQQLLDGYTRDFAEAIREEHSEAARIIDTLLDQPIPEPLPRIIDIPERSHGVTLPNELPLTLSGVFFSESNPLCSTEEQCYLDAILESALLLKKERDRLHDLFPENLQRQTVDLIITCPGVLHFLSSSKRVKSLFRDDDFREIKTAVRYHSNQDSYSNSIAVSEIGYIQNNPTFHVITKMWMDEIFTYTSAVELQTWGNFCPSLRLPRRIYQTRGLLVLLGKLIRTSGLQLSSRKINKLANHFFLALERVTDLLTPGFLDGEDQTIRIVADLPIGLIRERGLPLCLRHFVTQIPTTPGDLHLALACKTSRHFLDLSSRQHVTVIRSFKPNDPLRNILKDCIDDYSRLDGWDWQVDFVDVENTEQFIAACNESRTPFLIFDGHGSHDDESQVGAIYLGSEKVDVWSLRGKVIMPPIVFLSCCDSCPADRSHASSANGFLALGAKSVFGALMPIHGTLAGIMVARLLYRLTSVTRKWCKDNSLPLSLNKIITSQMRASYVSEFLLQLKDENLITKEQYDLISIPTTAMIAVYSKNWFTSFREAVKKTLEWSEVDFNDYVTHHFSFPHALHYLNLGHSEQILFATQEFSDKARSRVEDEQADSD